jgi:hypothetical protein
VARKVWTESDTTFLKLNRENMSNHEIAVALGCGLRTVLKKVQKFDIKRHKVSRYGVNSKFFNKLTEETCYWAGFCAAEFEGKVYLKERLGKGWSSQMYICDAGLIDALQRNFNIGPQKSLVLSPPNIKDQNLILAYIVGYIDGDGTVGHYKATHSDRFDWIMSVTGTYMLLSWIKESFDQLVPPISERCARVLNRTKNGKILPVFQYSIRGHRACPRLARKWEPYIRFKEDSNEA